MNLYFHFSVKYYSMDYSHKVASLWEESQHCDNTSWQAWQIGGIFPTWKKAFLTSFQHSVKPLGGIGGGKSAPVFTVSARYTTHRRLEDSLKGDVAVGGWSLHSSRLAWNTHTRARANILVNTADAPTHSMSSHSHWGKKKNLMICLIARNREVGLPGSHFVSEWGCGYRFPWLRGSSKTWSFFLARQTRRCLVCSVTAPGKCYHPTASSPISFLAWRLPGT